MNKIYKSVTFIVLSFILALISLKLKSSFSDKFADNVLALLTTLFAINIASSTLIAGKLREIQNVTGHPFIQTKKNLKNSFYEQIIFIIIAFIIGLIRESNYLKIIINIDNLKLICNSVLFLSFIYYIDIIRDLGKALFDLLDFPPES